MTQTYFESTNTIQTHRVSLPSSEDDQTTMIVLDEHKMFAESLHQMISNLTEMKSPLVAEWCNNGSLFVIHNQIALEPFLHGWFGKNVVPTCKTFLSLLNEYGFTKLNVEGSSMRNSSSTGHYEEEEQHAPGDEDLKFWHPCFHRDDKTSLGLIQKQVLRHNKVESKDDARSKSNCTAINKASGNKTKRSRQVQEDCKNNTQEGHTKKKSRTSIDRLRESVRSLRRSIEMLETAAHESLNGLQTKYDQILCNEFNVNSVSPTTQHSIPSVVCAQENKCAPIFLSHNEHGFETYSDLKPDKQQHGTSNANNLDDWSCHSELTLDPIKFSFDDWA